MISRVLHPLREAAWHPTDEQLVAFLDAELPAREATRVRRHVDCCWACRNRHRQLQETVQLFMDACAAGAAADEDDALLDVSRLPRAALHALHHPPVRPSAWSLLSASSIRV
ncbi:MAG: zf-HC2 domain-containing protein, partial [Vicinamibacterales bacterium]